MPLARFLCRSGWVAIPPPPFTSGLDPIKGKLKCSVNSQTVSSYTRNDDRCQARCSGIATSPSLSSSLAPFPSLPSFPLQLASPSLPSFPSRFSPNPVTGCEGGGRCISSLRGPGWNLASGRKTSFGIIRDPFRPLSHPVTAPLRGCCDNYNDLCTECLQVFSCRCRVPGCCLICTMSLAISCLLGLHSLANNIFDALFLGNL